VRLGGLTAALLLALTACAAAATTAGDARVAAVQVALHQRGLYDGTIDGVDGPAMERAVRTFQRRKGLVADGLVGPQTLAALRARPPLGTRVLRFGMRGLDVAELQFALAWHGFPSGDFDARFGLRTEAAVERFQRWARIPVDGKAGAATARHLRAAPPTSPIRLASPLSAPIGDPFGPRGSRFHAGVDFVAYADTRVGAAAPGTVAWAAYRVGGWGNLVVVAHGHGVRTLYAHLSRIDVHVGQRVAAGETLGLVGATGHATGPHLHFEVRFRGAAVDPQSAFR
jgi:murein DD-endopeptidase MepM/ murein hydrolase activator NlpD